MELQEFFKYLVEHPGAAKLLGGIILTIIVAPFIVIWARAGQVRRIHKAYTGLIDEQSTKIAELYRNFTDVHDELAKARGDLAMKIAELSGVQQELTETTSERDRILDDLLKLNAKVVEIEKRERELIEKLRKYEQG